MASLDHLQGVVHLTPEDFAYQGSVSTALRGARRPSGGARCRSFRRRRGPTRGTGDLAASALTATLPWPIGALCSPFPSTRFVLSGLLGPRVGDLLEHLAHPGLQEVALRCAGIAVPASDASRLTRVQVVVHQPILARRRRTVNWDRRERMGESRDGARSAACARSGVGAPARGTIAQVSGSPGGRIMRLLRAGALVIAASFVVASCGDSAPTAPATAAPSQAALQSDAPTASSTPAASQAPSATPTPPPDVATLASAAIADPALATTVTFNGRTKIGKATTTSSGSIAIDGRASHLVRSDKAGKATTRTETLTGNGERYEKQKGVWTRAGQADDTDLVGVLRGIPAMTDLGVEDKDGQQLHHLQAASVPAVPREPGLATKGVSDLNSTLDAWVTEDGTPVTMTLASTWNQKVGKQTSKASKTVDFNFTDVGGDVTVDLPSEVWKFFTSKRYKYRMAAPETFTVKAAKGGFSDSFTSGEEYVYASRARQSNATLPFITKGIVSNLKKITGYKGLKVTSNKKTTLDGVPARRVEFKGTSSGEPVYGQAVYAIKGAFWYFVGFDSFTKTSKDS